jgi:hypothetical protein
MDKLTTTIKREWLREIVAGRKRTEFREIKPYWTRRLGQVRVPFVLRLINGMSPTAPEVSVIVTKVEKRTADRQYALRLGRIVAVKHWDRRLERLSRRG